MKNRHNKKRNTAFLYEALTKEITKAVLEKDESRALKIKEFVKEHFKKGTALYSDLMLYNSLSIKPSDGTKESFLPDVERIVRECVEKRDNIDKVELFNQQTKLIEKINKTFGPKLFQNFVTNYKHMATIYQMFQEDNIAKRVLLEKKVSESLFKKKEEKILEPLDKIVFRKFVENFNQEYGKKLKKEQKELIERYVYSFADNGVMIKTFLNEELFRIKSKLQECKSVDEIRENEQMMRGVDNVLNIIEDFKKHPVNEKMVLKVLEIQDLISEALEDGN